MAKLSRTLWCCCLVSSGFSLEISQTQSRCVYCMIKLNLGTDENEVTAEELSAAVLDKKPCIPIFECDEDASSMEEVK